MAKKKTTVKLERMYTIPLRKEFSKAPRWKRSKRAVKAVRDFVKRHMKTDEVKIGKELNEYIWEKGSQNPPPRVKVITVKEEGVARVNLVGAGIPKEIEKVAKKIEKKVKDEVSKEKEAEKVEKRKAEKKVPKKIEKKVADTKQVAKSKVEMKTVSKRKPAKAHGVAKKKTKKGKATKK